MSNILFGVAIVILLGAIAGAVWSVVVPDRRFERRVRSLRSLPVLAET